MKARSMRRVGLMLACSLLLASFGSSGAGAASTGTASATRQVTATIVNLFNSNDPNEKARERLIQDASKYKANFYKLFSSAIAKSNPVVAQVTAVAFPGSGACRTAVKVPVCASVTYNLETAANGHALLTGLSAYVVYVDGKWLLSDVTFCGLAKKAGASC